MTHTTELKSIIRRTALDITAVVHILKCSCGHRVEHHDRIRAVREQLAHRKAHA